MSVDTRVLYVRKEGISRAEVEDLLDVDDGEVAWFGDQCFSIFTGVRFYEYEQSDPERRIRLALAPLSLELFERLEPFAVAYPDVAEFAGDDTLETVLESDATLRIEFHDFVPGDERLDAAAQEEARQMLKTVDAMLAFSRYGQKDAAFLADIDGLATRGRIDEMIARTRVVAELAPLVETLIGAEHFESCVTAARMSRR